MTFDYLVVGAGVSGMATALVLARQGRSVALIESAPRVAPLLRGFSRNGVQFDSGFHYSGGLGQGQVLSVVFDYLGVGKRIVLAPHGVEDTFRLLATGEDFPIPYDYRALASCLSERFPREEKGVRTYLEAVRNEFESTPFLNLDVNGESGCSPLQGTSLAEALRSWVDDPLLRQILSMHHFFYGVPPERISFVDHARFVGAYYASTRGVQGGGRALTAAFEAALSAAGVAVHCGRAASRLLLGADGALRGVELQDGERLPGRGVIVTLHPKALLRLAPKTAFRPAYARALQALEESPAAHMLFGVSDRPLPTLSRGGLHIAPKLGVSLAGLETQPLAERQLFVALAGDSPRQGEQAIGIICPTPHNEAEKFSLEKGVDAQEYAAYKQDAVSRLQERALQACPELQDRWRLLDAATPLTFRRFCHSPTGSLYGVMHALDARCPLPQTKLPGLHVAGQGVSGPGVLGATVSALVTCAAIVGRDTLLNEVRSCR